jgi:hypothetical protein
VNVGAGGTQADLDSFGPTIDAGGDVIAYYSAATTLVPETG